MGEREGGGAKPRRGRLISVPCPPVPPEMTVLPSNPVELGEPNVLICFVDKFSPPVIKVTWLRNGIPVTTGVSETVFLPREDHLFRKFSYLPFLPSNEDVYDCKVEHWGLEEPLLKHWGMDHPSTAFTSWLPSVMPESPNCSMTTATTPVLVFSHYPAFLPFQLVIPLIPHSVFLLLS